MCIRDRSNAIDRATRQVAIHNITGLISCLKPAHICLGIVTCSTLPTNKTTTTSSNDVINANKAPEITPGKIKGIITLKNVRIVSAPKLCDALIRLLSNPVKVAVTGAAGQIGYALLFRIASGSVFGPDTKVELQLLELEPALPALEGVKMELDDCAFPLLQKITTTSDAGVAFNDTDWILLVGAAPRKAGMERNDLLRVNGGIFVGQGKAIEEQAGDRAKILVIGNPCNTNCMIAMSHAPSIPKNRWFAMTALDENRARRQLAERSGSDISDVKNLCIWGNHSATQYPDFYNASIHGKPVTEVIQDEGCLLYTSPSPRD